MRPRWAVGEGCVLARVLLDLRDAGQGEGGGDLGLALVLVVDVDDGVERLVDGTGQQGQDVLGVVLLRPLGEDDLVEDGDRVLLHPSAVAGEHPVAGITPGPDLGWEPHPEVVG